jgi:hypothetical protein
MKESTGGEAMDSVYLRAMAAAEAKVGKTVALILWMLGQFPDQRYGALVTAPDYLHVISIDYGAITGAKHMLKHLGAPAEAANFHVCSIQEDYQAIFKSGNDWDASFYNASMQALRAIQAKVDKKPKGVHAVLLSSVTTWVAGIERGIAGPPIGESNDKKGSGMDESKWQAVYGQVNEFRNYVQAGPWHTVWEAHIDKVVPFGRNQDQEPKENIQIRGRAGRDFPNNVEQVFRIRRNLGDKYDGTEVDKMILDTRPSMEFFAGGRGATELLKPHEPDLVRAAHKLGMRVGGWGAKETFGKKVKK